MTVMALAKVFVQSSLLTLGQPVNEASAEGHVEPSGQQESPAQVVTEPGHLTESPTLHLGDGDGGDGVGGDGDGGDGVGDGRGVGAPVQSSVLPLLHPLKVASAEGHVEPSGQQESPAQFEEEPGHVTESPTLQGGSGLGPGPGLGPGVGTGDSGQ